MGHITPRSYYDLQKRLDKAPQGAPASESLFKILEILFTEKEAKLVSILPIAAFTAKKASDIWGIPLKETEKILNELADKGLLFDLRNNNEQNYLLAPTMAGFFEFSLMRTDGKFDRKILSELFYQYINVEDDFLREILGIDPSIVRTFVHEDMLQNKDQSVILDYERASKVISTASCITVGTCYCRHKMGHMNLACSMPEDVCLTFNDTAKTLSKHGIAKKISKNDAHKILDKCVNLGLVQIGDNVQEDVNFICNCCGCCCEALLAYKKLKYKMKITSNFESEVDYSKCVNCWICIKKCPVDAIKFQTNKKEKIIIDTNICIGCGVCARFCNLKALKMNRRKETQFVPKDGFERTIISAINKGKLQNLIFDNRDLWNQKMFRKLVQIIITLKPIQKKLANNQLQSRFLNNMIKSYSKVFGQFYKGKKLPDYSHPELKK